MLHIDAPVEATSGTYSGKLNQGPVPDVQLLANSTQGTAGPEEQAAGHVLARLHLVRRTGSRLSRGELSRWRSPNRDHRPE